MQNPLGRAVGVGAAVGGCALATLFTWGYVDTSAALASVSEVCQQLHGTSLTQDDVSALARQDTVKFRASARDPWRLVRRFVGFSASRRISVGERDELSAAYTGRS